MAKVITLTGLHWISINMYIFICDQNLGPRLAEEDDPRGERVGHHHREADDDQH